MGFVAVVAAVARADDRVDADACASPDRYDRRLYPFPKADASLVALSVVGISRVSMVVVTLSVIDCRAMVYCWMRYFVPMGRWYREAR